MKIHVDRNNNRIIANGHYLGKKVRAVAHCNGDTWDEEFGTGIASRRYAIKHETLKQKAHEQRVKMLHQTALWCYKQIDDENEIISRLKSKIGRMTSDCEAYIKSHFEGAN